MQKSKQRLNVRYISERVQEELRYISSCPITAVVAPMGYGKTTAVNWYLEGRVRTENAAVLRISIYSDSLAVFWKRVQNAFSFAGLPFLAEYDCPTDKGTAALVADELCRELAGEKPTYIFLDDFHLLRDGRAAAFLCTLAMALPDNVHLVVASRDRFLDGAQIVRLGGRRGSAAAEPHGAFHLRAQMRRGADRPADGCAAALERGLVFRHLSEPLLLCGARRALG